MGYLGYSGIPSPLGHAVSGVSRLHHDDPQGEGQFPPFYGPFRTTWSLPGARCPCSERVPRPPPQLGLSPPEQVSSPPRLLSESRRGFRVSHTPAQPGPLILGPPPKLFLKPRLDPLGAAFPMLELISGWGRWGWPPGRKGCGQCEFAGLC